MQDLWLVLLVVSLVVLPLICLILVLLLLLWKLVRNQQSLSVALLKDQQVENQLLRNQLLTLGNPEHLARLNYATLPSTKVDQAGSDPVDMTDLGEAINFEEGLAKAGYSIGELDHALESAGWSPAVIKRDGEDPIAFG